MQSFQHWPVQQKLTLMGVLTSLGVLLLTCTVLLAVDLALVRNAAVRRLSTAGAMLGLNSASGILFDDAESVTQTLGALQAQPDVVAARIYTTPDGRIFATYQREANAKDILPAQPLPEGSVFSQGRLTVTQPILVEGEPVGSILLASDLREMAERFQLYLKVALAILLASSGLAYLLSWQLQQLITAPLLELTSVVQRISSGKDFGIRAVKRTNDEVGALIEGFNAMLDQIQQQNKALEAARDTLERRVQERTQELQDEVVQRKQAQDALETYASALERSNQELDDFTYIVSHDLKEPLRSLDAYSKFLTEDYQQQLGAEGRQYLERIRANARRMQQLIEDLLNVSRLGKRPNELQVVDMNALLEEVKQRFEYALKEKGAQLVVPGPLPTLYGDRVRLTEVFANLISNAIKYGDKPVCRIEIRCQAAGAAYQFSVQDNGPGIAPQHFEKIFQIFQRLGKKEDQEGTGVGLAIVKKVVELHQGKVWVESALGEGTTFHFTIPKDEAVIRGKPKLGAMLVAQGAITEAQLEKTLAQQRRSGLPATMKEEPD